MKKVEIKNWFHEKKWWEMYNSYHCQKMDKIGTVIGETDKAYKLTVRALFISNEKEITIWAPKSACVEI